MAQIDWNQLSKNISSWGKHLGFADVGITNTDLGEHGDRLNHWLAKNYQGEMDYMSRHGSMRSHPEQLHPDTCSVISVRLDYLEPQPDPDSVLARKDIAYVSRYALGRDYHKVIRNKLKKLSKQIGDFLDDHQYEGFSSRVFTDSAPLLEKALAEKAGLGWIGKNTLLLNEKAGSWFFLGEMLTNLPLTVIDQGQLNRCGSCTACIDICPTNAIVAPYELDARLCISYLTIENRGSIPENLRASMGNRVFGCDDCQLVCPWNRYAKSNAEDDFRPRHGLDQKALLDLFNWDEDQFLKKTEGSAIRRTGYEGWQRNLAIGLGNSPRNPEVIQALETKKGRSNLLDEHVSWAIDQHSKVER